jgi:Holliday junction resolvasome RuvABC endonuclease subunit
VGWCLAQGDRYIDSGTYRPRGNADERIRQIAGWVHDMLITHNPDQVAIETPTGDHRNRRTDRLLGRVGGNIEGICHTSDIAVTWIHAMTVKSTGFHKDAKTEAALLVGKARVSADEADAIGLWQAWLYEMRMYYLLSELEEVSDAL